MYLPGEDSVAEATHTLAKAITLAYRYEGHGPDETIEVDDAVGRQLVRDGFARPAESTRQPIPVVSPPAPPGDDDDGLLLKIAEARAQRLGRAPARPGWHGRSDHAPARRAHIDEKGNEGMTESPLELGPYHAGEIPEPFTHTFENADGTPVELAGDTQTKFTYRLNRGAGVELDAQWNAETATATVRWADPFPAAGMLEGQVWVGNGENRYASRDVVARIRPSAAVPKI
jgi:hypothetical protein